LFSFEAVAGQWIEVRKGAVWITRPDEPRDIVLEAGDSLEINDTAGMIVGAINGAAEVWTDVAWSHAAAA
jgi:hypothetical protein